MSLSKREARSHAAMSVMRGLKPGIYVDGRVNSGHDAFGKAEPRRCSSFDKLSMR